MPYSTMAQAENEGTQKAEPSANGDNDAVKDKDDVYINKRPMRDFLLDAQQKIEANEIALDLEFKVAVAATLGLGKDGKTIILLHPKIVQDQMGVNNDPRLEKLALDAILAVGDSGWFGYIYPQNVRNVVITLEQNDTEFIVNLKADQPNETDAKRTASGLNGLLEFSMPTLKPEEKELLDRVSVVSEGNFFKININLPKQTVHELIKRELDKAKQTEGNSITTANGIK